jgi:ubiquinone/menaquinone biosynthesis C-methylase UbiE
MVGVMTDDHVHDHGHQHDGAEYFDQAAGSWDDDPAKVERARVVAQQIIEQLDPAPDARLFEYGAGTGLVAQHLQAHVAQLTLADSSAGMREAMAAKVADGRLPEGTRIWDLDLATQPVPAGERFDLAVTVQVLHHVHDVEPVLRRFAELLEPGGHLCVVDLELEDGSFHGEGFGGHHGFRRDELGAQLETAGFADVTFRHSYDLEKNGHAYPLFLAIATRS